MQKIGIYNKKENIMNSLINQTTNDTPLKMFYIFSAQEPVKPGSEPPIGTPPAEFPQPTKK